MGIRVDFMIKHVRPYGMTAWVDVCGTGGDGSLEQWLIDSNVPESQIEIAFSAWARTANLEIIQANLPEFVQSANVISQARWSEWYQTEKSTILFLTAPLMEELGEASENSKNKVLEFRPGEGIPLAITINQDPSVKAQVVVNAAGIKVSVDENGNCYHFGGLL